MMYSKIISVILCSVLGISASAKTPVKSVPCDSIPFEIGADHKIYVNATINSDTVPLRFLFDTGAVDNVLNINSSRAIKNINQAELIDGVNISTTSTTAAKFTPFNNSITLGETGFSGVRFVLSPAIENIDGIIGWNTLTGADFMIDYDKQQIFLFPKGSCELNDEVADWLTLAYIDGLPSINISYIFEGQSYETNVWIDSGSNRCLDLITPYIKANNLQGKQNPWGISSIVGMEGTKGKIEEVIAETVKIGNYILYQIPIGLNLTNSGASANKNFGGVLGNNLLERFNQIWSFENKRLYLTPNRRMYSTNYPTQNELLQNKVTLK